MKGPMFAERSSSSLRATAETIIEDWSALLATRRTMSALRSVDCSHLAVIPATREGLKNFSEKEQKDLRQVQVLLRLAENRAGTPHERRAAYERAIRTLRGILGEIPQDALLEIESRAKKDGIMLALFS